MPPPQSIPFRSLVDALSVVPRRSPAERARARRAQVAAAKRLADGHEQARQAALRRRARLRSAPIRDLTRSQWQAILAAWDHTCAYCGATPAKLEMDHVVPIARGGSHTASNVLPACRPCNRHKRDNPAPAFDQARHARAQLAARGLPPIAGGSEEPPHADLPPVCATDGLPGALQLRVPVLPDLPVAAPAPTAAGESLRPDVA